MTWLKEILLSFFCEIDDAGAHSDDELEHYANRCMEQIEFALKARIDFRDKEE